MKNFLVLFGVILVFLSPCISHADEIATSTTATSTSTIIQDGSTEPPAVVKEKIQGWWGQTIAEQQKILTMLGTSVASVPMPVLFGVGVKDISPNFGDPRPNGRTHEGEDIIAVKGTPIISPTAAVVLRTEFGLNEGNTVYTANPGGETFVYMHLDRFGEGVVQGSILQAGSLIGYVGNTGNASGGAAHLHFEIHNPAGDPTNPFLRLTSEFSLSDKITYLSKILTQTTDAASLSNFLVLNFRKTFTDAQSQNIVLPGLIITSLSTIATSSVQTSQVIVQAPQVAQGDLTIGSRGDDVLSLQKYLILKAVGAEAKALAANGATGYFGLLTQAAVREYQTAMNIYPADGYYGTSTRTSVLAGIGNTTQVSTPVTPVVSQKIEDTTLSRDLHKGMTGEDVRTLQKFLNTHGFPVAPTGAGSIGFETTLFGGATYAAVIRFQTSYSISPAVGYVGPLTRAKILSLN